MDHVGQRIKMARFGFLVLRGEGFLPINLPPDFLKQQNPRFELLCQCNLLS